MRSREVIEATRARERLDVCGEYILLCTMYSPRRGAYSAAITAEVHKGSVMESWCVMCDIRYGDAEGTPFELRYF